MNRMLLIFLAAAILPATARADEVLRARNMGEVPRLFSATCDTSTAPFACTIQQPVTGASKVRLVSAIVFCAVPCELLQSRNGTAATATAATVRDVSGKGVPARAAVFLRSDAGSGSMAVDAILPPPGIEQGIPYRDSVYLIGSGEAINYTWRLATDITGRFKVIVYWEEY